MPIINRLTPFPTVEIAVWKITETDEKEFQFFQTGPAFQQRLEEIKHPKRRLEHLASRAALDYLFPESTIYYKDKKPLLTDGSHLSFSHNVHYAVCARSLNSPIGIDLESARPDLLTKVQHKFLHREEEAFVSSSRDLQIIWGAKEALYKFFGNGGVDFKEHLRVTSKPPEGAEGYFSGAIKGIASHDLQLYFKLWGSQTLVVAHVPNF